MHMAKTDKLYTIEEIKEILRPIFLEYKLKKVAVFGSYALNKATPESDIDMLVSSRHVFDLDTYSDFEDKIEKSLHKNIDIVFYDYINPHMRDSILKEAVSIFEQ
jgi:predicted nucleotidyltransferase